VEDGYFPQKIIPKLDVKNIIVFFMFISYEVSFLLKKYLLLPGKIIKLPDKTPGMMFD